MAKNSTSFQRGHRGGGRPKSSRNKVTVDAQMFARHLLDDPAYMASLRRRLIRGQARHMEPVLWSYAFGRPAERHEIAALIQPPAAPTPATIAVDSAGTAAVAGLTLTRATRERVLSMLEAQGATPAAERAASASSESAG